MTFYNESQGTGIVNIGYDDLGRRSFVNRLGSSTVTQYDPMSRLSLLSHHFANSADNLVQTFAYNPAGEVTSETKDDDAFAYTGIANASTAYVSNGLNQITAAGSASLTWDSDGNLTSDGTNAYVHDPENRLIHAGGANAENLYYDPLGRLWLTLADVGGGARLFAYDGGEMVKEYDQNGTPLNSFVHGPNVDEVLVDYQDSPSVQRRFPHADRLGSIVASADTAGNRLSVNTYDEYGVAGSANQGRFGYTGQAALPEIGVDYYKARMYLPGLGRFLQTDPILYAAGSNFYQYAGSNPVNFTDPTGLSCEGDNPVGTEGENCAPITVTAKNPNKINVTESTASFPFFLLLPDISLPSLNLGLSGSTGDNQQCQATGLLAPPAAIAGEAAAAVVISPLAIIALLALLPGGDTPRANPQYVVRGGVTTPQSLISSSRQNAQYGVVGFSVNTAPGMSVDQIALAAPVRNGQISYTTTAQLANVGVPVVPTPTENNLHATAVVPVPLDPTRAAAISGVFKQKNNPAVCK